MPVAVDGMMVLLPASDFVENAKRDWKMRLGGTSLPSEVVPLGEGASMNSLMSGLYGKHGDVGPTAGDEELKIRAPELEKFRAFDPTQRLEVVADPGAEVQRVDDEAAFGEAGFRQGRDVMDPNYVRMQMAMPPRPPASLPLEVEMALSGMDRGLYGSLPERWQREPGQSISMKTIEGELPALLDASRPEKLLGRRFSNAVAARSKEEGQQNDWVDAGKLFARNLADGPVTAAQGGYSEAAAIAGNPEITLSPWQRSRLDSLRALRAMLTSEIKTDTGEPLISPDLLGDEVAKMDEEIAALAKTASDRHEGLGLDLTAEEYREQAKKLGGQRELFRVFYPVDRDFEESFLGNVVAAGGQLIPQMVLSQLPYVGMAAMHSQSFQQALDDARETAERLGVPYDEKKAQAYAFEVAFNQALLDRAGVDSVLGKWLGEGGDTVMQRVIKRMASSTGEGFSEMLEGASQDYLASGHGIEERDPLNIRNRGREFAVGTAIGMPMAGVHTAAEVFSPGENSTKGKTDAVEPPYEVRPEKFDPERPQGYPMLIGGPAPKPDEGGRRGELIVGGPAKAEPGLPEAKKSRTTKSAARSSASGEENPGLNVAEAGDQVREPAGGTVMESKRLREDLERSAAGGEPITRETLERIVKHGRTLYGEGTGQLKWAMDMRNDLGSEVMPWLSSMWGTLGPEWALDAAKKDATGAPSRAQDESGESDLERLRQGTIRARLSEKPLDAETLRGVTKHGAKVFSQNSDPLGWQMQMRRDLGNGPEARLGDVWQVVSAKAEESTRDPGPVMVGHTQEGGGWHLGASEAERKQGSGDQSRAANSGEPGADSENGKNLANGEPDSQIAEAEGFFESVHGDDDFSLAYDTTASGLFAFSNIVKSEMSPIERSRVSILTDYLNNRAGDLGRVIPEGGIVATAVRGRAFGKAGKRMQEFIDKFTKLTGTTVMFFETNEKKPSTNGLVKRIDPNHIYIHARSPRPLDALIGHEWGHTLQNQDEELYRDLQRAVFKYMEDWRQPMAEIDKRAYKSVKARGVEVTNNALGDAMMDPLFWKSVGAEINSSLFQRLYRSIMNWFDSIVKKERVAFGTEAFSTDLRAMRDELAKVVAVAIKKGPYKRKIPTWNAKVDLGVGESLSFKESFRQQESEGGENITDFHAE